MAKHPQITMIDVKEFREAGYLQEINRRFLHPLGLALMVAISETGQETIAGVWDYRNDLEGLYFDECDAEKARAVADEWDRRRAARVAALGFMVQPAEIDVTGTGRREMYDDLAPPT